MTNEMTEDERGQFGLSRRKVLGSMAIIGAAGAGAGAGTWAWFQDDHSIEDNTISAGELSLNEGTGAPFTIEDAYPGMDAVTESISFQENSGNLPNSETTVVVDLGAVVHDSSNGLASHLELTPTYNWNGGGSAGTQTLDQWDGHIETDLPRPGPGNTGTLDCEVNWIDPPANSGDVQGESVEVDIYFLLRQEEADSMSSLPP